MNVKQIISYQLTTACTNTVTLLLYDYTTPPITNILLLWNMACDVVGTVKRLQNLDEFSIRSKRKVSAGEIHKILPSLILMQSSSASTTVI